MIKYCQHWHIREQGPRTQDPRPSARDLRPRTEDPGHLVERDVIYRPYIIL